LALFGKDIEKNVFLMLTFADGSTPPVLSAVKEFKLHYESYFKFNNSVFTVESNHGKSVELNNTAITINGMFWDMAYEAYKNFFKKLGTTEAKSLTLTREVLQERQRLQENIEVLNRRVKDGVNQLITMREELPFITEFEAEKTANKNYTTTIDVLNTRRVHFNDGHFVTNCMKCNQTCHDNCAYANDSDKVKCVAMESDGYCKVCKNRCYWNVHFHQNYFFEDYFAREVRTIDDMKNKYLEADSKLSLKENLLVGITKEYNKIQKDVLEAVELIRKSLERLNEIAMRPDPLSTVQYIDMLIEATKRDKQPGWLQRIDQLENARKRAMMIKEMREKGKEYDPFADLQKEIETKASKTEGLKDKIYKFFGFKK
jgi:Tfp pilus assembly protein PilE